MDKERSLCETHQNCESCGGEKADKCTTSKRMCGCGDKAVACQNEVNSQCGYAEKYDEKCDYEKKKDCKQCN